MKQFVIQEKFNLSADMFLAIGYIAQNHDFRRVVHGKTLNALRRRQLIDHENELTSFGWSCYLELTDAGPCPTDSFDGYKAKDPRLLHLKAKPRLDALIENKQERKQQFGQASSEQCSGESTPNQIYDLMNQDELRALGVEHMSNEQRAILMRWGLRMQNQCVSRVSHIDRIKYGGRLLILIDGTHWQVNESDVNTSQAWSEMDRVVVIDGEMFKLDESEKIRVEQED